MKTVAEIAWLDCPYGRLNDPFPGRCELYVDTNNDRICDRSQPGGVKGLKGVKDAEGIIIFLTLAVYFVHWYLVRKTNLGEKFWWLGRRQFRYFWNLILLLTFIPVAVSGLLLAFGVTNFDFNLWHNRLGLVFATVALLHLLERFRYFLKIPSR